MHHMEIYNEGLSDVALYIKKNKRTNLEEGENTSLLLMQLINSRQLIKKVEY